MNPLLSMMGGGMPGNMGNIMQMIGMLKGSSDPRGMLQNMAQGNPQIRQAMDMCQGKNPKDVFFQECQNRGVNPQQIMGMIK